MFVEKKVLLSIKPIYAEKILNGSKLWELRKSAPVGVNRLVVFMYASRPVHRVVGMFECVGIRRMQKYDFWRDFGHECGVSEDEFFRYYHGCSHVVGWRVGDVHPFSTIFGLGALGLERPPMSWQYFECDVYKF